ncbi:hypothetical protein UFOVP1360_34 [uncultured Caudovirales phage]|uniref:Uncharacterized protein n=1 Tax=uncultured Caudovirales phage TaxID=2100421 RepID=A0A6J5RYF9_9CAUD|nr:hypothetical protein UFOVP1360_34 [uncultured Caudovirales phage]
MNERYAIERHQSGEVAALIDVCDEWEEARERLLEALDEMANGRVTVVAKAAYEAAYRIVDKAWPVAHPPEPLHGIEASSWTIEVNGAVRYGIRRMADVAAPEPAAPVVPHLHDALDALRRLAEAGDPTAVVVLHIYEGDAL